MLKDTGFLDLGSRTRTIARERRGKRIKPFYTDNDAMTALLNIVEFAKKIEEGKRPYLPLDQVRALRPVVIDLREAVYKDASLARLRQALPHIERAYGIVRQYAEQYNKGGYTSPEEETILDWLRGK